MSERKSGLGRNLNVLLSHRNTTNKSSNEQSSVCLLEIEKIQPGKYQPRKNIKEDSLLELTESIKQQGLLQPIAIRRISPDKFEIIAGERRFRAAKLAGLKKIPCIIHQVDDKTTLALALIENIQRQDLNPIEEAQALYRLINEFDITHQKAADMVGKSRASVSNLLRLMNLDDEVKELLIIGKIEMGHARALLALEKTHQPLIAEKIVALELTVRQAEYHIKQFLNPKVLIKKTNSEQQREKAMQFQKNIGLKVKIQSTEKGKHKVIIHCNDQSELDKLLDNFTK